MIISEVFTCPECGEHHLEEVMLNVTVSSEVTSVDEFEECEYDVQTNDGGEVDRYECAECGWVVPNVKDAFDLFNWLKKAK
jgi:hypothetical protein